MTPYPTPTERPDLLGTAEADERSLVQALRLIAHDGPANAALAVEMADWLERRIATAPRRPRREKADRHKPAARRGFAGARFMHTIRQGLARSSSVVLGLF